MSVAHWQTETGMSVRDYVDARAYNAPDELFLIDPETETKFSNLEAKQRIVATANRLYEFGLKPGDPVAYAFSNGVNPAIAILGILYGGFLATAINLVAGDMILSYVLDHSGVRLIIADDRTVRQLAPLAEASKKKPKILHLDEIVKYGQVRPDIEYSGFCNTDGLLMYTSGTTGRPKGVLLTQANLLAGGKNAAQAHALKADDCGLCVLPFYHINAFCVSLMGSLLSGGSLVIPERFSVSSFWNMVRNNRCSWFSVVPTQIAYLLHNSENPGGDAQGCTQLRFGRSASAPLSPEMHRQFEERFNIPVIETMGLTETAAQILSNPLPPNTRKIGSPGIAVGNEIMIGDEQQNSLPTGEEGEILVRGPNLLRCYLDNEEATRAAITPQGWFRTGDLGRRDKDGFVFVTGRLKELIIKGGENIAPREVDEALYLHPDVIEAAAFAVKCNDFGQRVEAGVVLSSGSNATTRELLEICAQRLGDFKSPDCIHFLSELPKGPSGKIQRMKLAELVRNT